MSSRSKGKMFVCRYLNDLFLCLRRVDGVGSGENVNIDVWFFKALLKHLMMVLEKALVKAWGHHWTCQWRFCCLKWKSSPPLLYYVTPWDTKRCKTKCFTDRQLVKHSQLKTFWCLNWVQRKEDSKWKGQNSTMVCGAGLVPSPTYMCFHVCLCWLLSWPL